MAQFVTHIQPTMMEASQGHLPHHHSHQVGMQHTSHLPHSGHNMPSPPTHINHKVRTITRLVSLLSNSHLLLLQRIIITHTTPSNCRSRSSSSNSSQVIIRRKNTTPTSTTTTTTIATGIAQEIVGVAATMDTLHQDTTDITR